MHKYAHYSNLMLMQISYINLTKLYSNIDEFTNIFRGHNLWNVFNSNRKRMKFHKKFFFTFTCKIKVKKENNKP